MHRGLLLSIAPCLGSNGVAAITTHFQFISKDFNVSVGKAGLSILNSLVSLTLKQYIPILSLFLYHLFVTMFVDFQASLLELLMLYYKEFEHTRESFMEIFNLAQVS